MPRYLPWINLAITLPRADTDILLETFKSFNIGKNNLVPCCICTVAAPHLMRTQLLSCICDACMAVETPVPCPWHGRVRTCQILQVANVDELHAHITPRAFIGEAKIDFGDEGRGSRLGRPRAPLAKASGYTGQEEETTPFTFAWRYDAERKPIVGNGSDQDAFVVGMTTKKLLRHADRDPATFMLHIDATYKISQVGYPVIVVGISDRARHFHLLAVFTVSQEAQEQYPEVLSMLMRIYQFVTGKILRIQFAMGDADMAQWNALHDAIDIHSYFRFLMCCFHVAKTFYEKTRCLDSNVAAMVMGHLHELHLTSSGHEYHERLAEVNGEWAKWTQLTQFSAYFDKIWLNDRVWRWLCYHTLSGFAATNKPCEAFNAVIKRDVTMRRRLKVGTLLEQLLILCRGDSVRSKSFESKSTFTDRLARRARALTRGGLLYETTFERGSIAFLRAKAPSDESGNFVHVMALPVTRKFDVLDRRSREDLAVTAQLNVETAKMERKDMPPCRWRVDVAARTCPCRFHMKHGSCVHVLFALGATGSSDATGHETLFYRGTNKRKRAHTSAQSAGHPR